MPTTTCDADSVSAESEDQSAARQDYLRGRQPIAQQEADNVNEFWDERQWSVNDDVIGEEV
jgi:hypothetical protein